MTTFAFIQARMGSSRLPGKVIKPLAGKPVILHIVERLRLSQKLDKIVVLTSTNEENIPLVDLLKAHNIPVFQGDEDNVLKRFQDALVAYPCDYVVRITGDSPLVDATICDNLIESFKHQSADYAYLSERFAEGVDCEVIDAARLAELECAQLRPSELEHVTLHFYDNSANQYVVVKMENSCDDSHYRYTLDTIEDWQVIDAFYIANENPVAMSYSDVKAFFDNNPEIKALNQHIVRNEGLAISLEQDKSGGHSESI